MSWNYRVLRHDDGSCAIYAVYYDKTGLPSQWSAAPSVVLSDEVEGLSGVLVMMRGALQKPVLTIRDNALVATEGE